MGAHDSTGSPPRKLSLLVEPASGQCQHVPVDRNPFVIGRHTRCDLVLADNRISRRHARIANRGRGYVLEDLGSRNGVFLNGKRVSKRAAIVEGDRLGFGVGDSYQITIREGHISRLPLLQKVAGLGEERKRTGTLGRLSAMLDVARTMESASGVDDVFAAVLEAALAIANAERAFLLLRDSEAKLVVRAARSTEGRASIARGLTVPLEEISRALDRRAQLFSMDLDVSTLAEGSPRAALCVPILRMRLGHDHETTVISAKRDTLGALYMDSRHWGMLPAEANQALLHALAIEVSTSVENARLLEQARQKRRLEQELSMAREIQRALLPTALPRDGWLLARGHSEPSSRLGGDYYDLMRLAAGNWAAVLADVSGKGPAASILASLLQGAFFLGAGPEVSLAGTLARINRYLCERSRNAHFATVFAASLLKDGHVRWSNAGHCPAIIVRRFGQCELLAPNSRPVGIFENAEFREDECRLWPRDKLVVYSDGVTELRNTALEPYGLDRLRLVASKRASLGIDAFFDALLESVEAFGAGSGRQDDLTLMVVEFRGTTATAMAEPTGLRAGGKEIDAQGAAADAADRSPNSRGESA